MNCRHFPPDARQKGFGVLEALVALVLLSSVGLTLLAWIQQNLDTLQRLRGVYAEVDARKSVLAWSRTLNPLEQPSGDVSIGTLRIAWKATATSGPVPQIGYPAGVGLHDLALYDVSISVFRPNEPDPWFSQTIVCVGHKKARELLAPFSRE